MDQYSFWPPKLSEWANFWAQKLGEKMEWNLVENDRNIIGLGGIMKSRMVGQLSSMFVEETHPHQPAI